MTIKLTKKRKEILDVLKNSKDALTAKDIHSLVEGIDLVTVYRNLDLFTKEQLITPLHFGNSETRYEFQQTPHHHAICNDCKKIIHFDADGEKLKNLIRIKNFNIESLEVTVRGNCGHG